MNLGEFTIIGIGKQLDEKRSGVGMSYHQFKWEGRGYEGALEDDYFSYSAGSINFALIYYLGSATTSLFNPYIAGTFGTCLYKVENQTLQLSDHNRQTVFSFSIFNRIKVFEKVHLAVGLGTGLNPYFSFDENGKIYKAGTTWDSGPIISIDITIPFPKKKD